MSITRPSKNILAIVLGTSALMASFALALAATVQTSVEVPASADIVQAHVLVGDGLFISHDEEGNDPVNFLNFNIVEYQPPLSSEPKIRHRIYLRNDSDIDLTIISPCGNARDDATDARIGFLAMWLENTENNEGSCEWNDPWVISPDETHQASVELNLDEGTEVGFGSYSFTIVFGALGDE